MRYGLVIAGGSGTRLWPMSRGKLPKQLIPFINGASLLEVAMQRLEGLLPRENLCICAGQTHEDSIMNTVPQASSDRFYGEPMGRDTLNAVGLVAADLCQVDGDAVIGVFTADHLIEPIDAFHDIVRQGFEIAEACPKALVTFGITPTHPATGYGYLALGERLDLDESAPGPRSSAGSTNEGAARVVKTYKEKPDADTAQAYLGAGPDSYLWSSGMFVWRAATLMKCIERHAPENFPGLHRLGQIWRSDARQQELDQIYPKLKKISVDYAVMEPASRDPDFQVVAVPMPLKWRDIGSWPAFADTCTTDDNQNQLAAATNLMMDSNRTLVVSSDDTHLIATIGCDDLMIIHTPNATLICPRDRAEEIKTLHGLVVKQFGSAYQ